ncbi:Hypothetical protein NTJ_04987 [Nesidiocoris tenuis]|uniref:Uncharacterized protein n=1 Tax=Nesidiocoris tenuis TaxID=355587 RepID=A0ABN7AL83_9HEMI|nr:Hypothetical protein NTJ_04987 [Nesidiocoris tenuis]
MKKLSAGRQTRGAARDGGEKVSLQPSLSAPFSGIICLLFRHFQPPLPLPTPLLMFLKRQFPLLASCAQFNWVSLRRDLGLPDTFDLPDFTRRAKSSLCPMGFKQFRLAEAAISKCFDPPIRVRTSILRICGARLEIRLGGERLPVERKMAYGT